MGKQHQPVLPNSGDCNQGVALHHPRYAVVRASSYIQKGLGEASTPAQQASITKKAKKSSASEPEQQKKGKEEESEEEVEGEEEAVGEQERAGEEEEELNISFDEIALSEQMESLDKYVQDSESQNLEARMIKSMQTVGSTSPRPQSSDQAAAVGGPRAAAPRRMAISAIKDSPKRVKKEKKEEMHMDKEAFWAGKAGAEIMSHYKMAQPKKLGCFQMKLSIWKQEIENAARKLDPSVVAQKKLQFQKVPWNPHGSPIVLMLPSSASFRCPAIVEEFKKLNDEERDLQAAAFVKAMNENMAGTCQSISGLHRLTALLELGLLDSVTGLVTLYEHLPEQQYRMLGKYYQLLDQSISKHNFAERLAFIWKQSKVADTSATANEWTSMWAELEAYEEIGRAHV